MVDDGAIRSLIARLAQLADSGSVEEYVALFTPDAVWSMPANPAVGLEGSERKGRDDIGAGVRERRASGVQGPGSNTRHMVTTIAVSVEGDDRASADSYFLFVVDTAAAPRVASVGAYRDTFGCVEGRWLLERREITIG